jgi:hypothetical protein
LVGEIGHGAADLGLRRIGPRALDPAPDLDLGELRADRFGLCVGVGRGEQKLTPGIDSEIRQRPADLGLGQVSKSAHAVRIWVSA